MGATSGIVATMIGIITLIVTASGVFVDAARLSLQRQDARLKLVVEDAGGGFDHARAELRVGHHGKRATEPRQVERLAGRHQRDGPLSDLGAERGEREMALVAVEHEAAVDLIGGDDQIMLESDAGVVEVLGLKWNSDERELRERLGISLQQTQLAEKLTVEETIRLFRSFYSNGREPEEVMEAVQLTDKRRAWVSKLCPDTMMFGERGTKRPLLEHPDHPPRSTPSSPRRRSARARWPRLPTSVAPRAQWASLKACRWP